MKIGFIGLGHMGGPMARNLLKAGHALTVFDLSEAALDEAKTSGRDARRLAARGGRGERSRHHDAAGGRARAQPSI